MSAWKEIKKSINNDLTTPINKQLSFPTAIKASENAFWGNRSDKTIIQNNLPFQIMPKMKFLVSGTINFYAITYMPHIPTSQGNRYIHFQININGTTTEMLAKFPLGSGAARNIYTTKEIQINAGDVVSVDVTAVDTSNATTRISYFGINADLVYDKPYKIL